ncbi:MAG TPA: peptidoglycan-binding protein [Ornithinimicrobium sp.]|uniref:L,D-transpeptidase family protein n=1 Tax=Ornithinimicrobium sp. TaxID=1977084 RepID=UPI002B4742C3|nr:peptidoglycan-binding protein [Ornithinimicrobium sp.]HKJ12033.1 peptidoglycan-binding protein [Ornithinimicrobium sp.]
MTVTNLETTRRAVLLGGVGAGVATVLAAEPAAATHNLRRGSRGSGVASLQRSLAARGYWCGRADGVFGHLTQQAVWALQKRHGLVRDAIVGPNTRAALAYDTTLRPVGGSGSRFEVHLRRQLVLEVRRGRTYRVFNTSTGNGKPYQWYGRTYYAHTYRGDFRVHSTYGRGWQKGQLGALYRPAYFDRGRALHGSRSIPPYPASHGCCRLSTAATNLLWAGGRMQWGTRVLVV